MRIDPAVISSSDRYKLLIGGIVPRPIAWVSTLGASGEENLAPFSFFCGVSSVPMLLAFCPANKPDGTIKDTLRNARPAADGGTGEFVVNIVSDALGARMALSAEPLAYGDSEWKAFGVEREASVKVRPARVAGAPLALECITRQVLSFAPGQPGGGNMIIGEVVSVWVEDAVIDERLHIDPAKLDAIARMGGQTYARTRERFDMKMGR